MIKYVRASSNNPISDEGPNLNDSHYYYRLDKDVFIMGFDGYKDKDGDEYHYEIEYWLDDDSWHFLKVDADDHFSVEFPKDKKYKIMELMQDEMTKAKGDR